MHENGPARVCRCLASLILVFPAGDIVGKRRLGTCPENAAESQIQGGRSTANGM
jgi:hypothetical protein